MRIFAVCLGFNTPEMVRGALENFEATTTDEEHRRLVKTLFWCGYPLPDVESNRRELHALAAEYGWWVTDIPNRGVMENHNVAIHDYCHLVPGDFYICFDPDVRMQQTGWVSAMVDALRSDANAVFCCAARPYHDEDWCAKAHGRTVSAIRRPMPSAPAGDLRIARYRELIAWSMGMWKGEWLAARPRYFKASHPHYGYAEHADIALMKKHRKTWLSLVDYYDHHVGSDVQYTAWKVECAGGKTKAPFDQWLKGNR